MLCLSTPHADCILPVRATEAPTSTLPQHAPRRMHLDVAPVSANASALPKHVLRGLHRGDRAVVSAIGIFASARPTRIASLRFVIGSVRINFASARPTRIASALARAFRCGRNLCLSTSYADCISSGYLFCYKQPALPQHVLRGLHPDLRPQQARVATLPQHVLRGLHPGVGKRGHRADDTLPQHVLRGLHRQKRTR